jgi:stage II sporulation protein D
VDPNQLTPEQKEMNRKAKLALGATSHLVDALIEIHVAIATKAGVLAVGGSTPVEVQDDKGKTLYQLAAGEIYTAAAAGDGIAIGNQSLPVSVWLAPAPGGLFYLGNRPYRGKLLLVNQGGKLWAINYVNLRQYLHSVVASEVSSSWSPEALKAQAVAARSYALTYYFKPANPLYHLGSDEYYQVYSGIEREAASTNQAVDDTSGQYVSYKGGIVESLYAASDDIVAEAFQGRGMSQLGALSLANQGYKYAQILAKYYPGTAVGAIAADGE